MKSKIVPIIMVFILCALAVRISPVSISNHGWSPAAPLTNDTLNCSWDYSADTTAQNITILRNSVLFNNTFENASLVTLSSSFTVPPENTNKNDVWVCNITLYNDTASTSSEKSVTIGNTPPTTESGDAGIFYDGTDIGYYFTILEDTTYVIDVNATDADGDPIDYKAGEEFCTRTSQALGLYSCAPTQSYLVNNSATAVNISFTFWDPQNPGGRKVLFNITPVNDAPAFNPSLSNKNINEGQVFNYPISCTDEENNIPLNFSITLNSSLDLIINVTSNTSALIMFEGNRTATYNEAGSYTVNVTVYDSLNASSTASFKLTITQVNAAPVLRNISTQNGTQGQPFLFYVYADDPDENNTPAFDISSIDCSITNPWSISTINNSHNATGLVNVTNLTNDNVVCWHVRITVIDGEGAEDSQDVFLNISNTNDPPNVVVLSSYSNNTGGDNLSSLIAYAESPFVYLVNATDPDQLTYAGDNLTFSDNSTFFDIIDINYSIGLISFTPNQSLVGNHTINITVTDANLSSDSKDMHLEIINNSAPVLTSIGNLSCSEDTLCLIAISATDADSSDNLTFTSNDSEVFSLTDNNSQSPVWRAYVNYTPEQDIVGNHSVVITVTDIRGAFDTETILFTVNNTNNLPTLQSFYFPSKIVETHTVGLSIYADDDDYSLPSNYAYIIYDGATLTEYVTFNVINITGEKLFDINTSLNPSNNQTYGRIIFTPLDGKAGNYSVNITATDYVGAIDWVVKNFTVLVNTSSPNITQIMPYGKPFSNDTVFNFTDTSNYGSSLTSINFSENRSVTYNITATDDSTAQENLTYAWYINGSLEGTSSYLEVDYDFFSAGEYNITVFVNDDTYENSSWTWNATVGNVNRAPLLVNELDNITLNTTETFSNYLKWEMLNSNQSTFLDPDDDLNSDGFGALSETSHLNFNITSCSVATIGLANNNNGIRVEPTEIGICTVTFLAYDSGGLTKTSNIVRINVTSLSNATQEVEVPQPTSGGGGGGYSMSVITPARKEEEKPKPIELVVPNLVTIYENKTVLIPVTIQNNWNASLKEVRINATSNASSVKLRFTQDYFPELKVGEKKDITLMVDNYRMGENYEIKITANVTNPKASDSALVLLNTIEQSKEGPDVQTKVTFAQDLLRENPECLELNELLTKAKESLEKGSTAEASKMVDGVINGCKYLVSIAKKGEQKPQSIIAELVNKENLKYFLMFIGVASVITLATLLAVKRRKTAMKKEEKKENKENKEGKVEEKEEIKPYWPEA
jgi:hypothetical protein